jgi:ribonuclease E
MQAEEEYVKAEQPRMEEPAAPPGVEAPPAPEPEPVQLANVATVSENEVVCETPQSSAPIAEAATHASGARADSSSILATLRTGGSSELIQIETDPGKVRPFEEPQEAPRPLRVRRPPPPISNEPLIQVETRRREHAPEALT